MTLLFQASKKFENDLKRFDNKEQRRIILKINNCCSLFEKQKNDFLKYAMRPFVPHLASGLNSSMYALRIDNKIRVVLTMDEDPIFDKIVVTLMRVVRHDDLNKCFRGVAESLYQQDLIN